MSLLSLFGLDRRLRRLKIAVGEGAIAAEDRAQLLRMAWEDEKRRLKRAVGLTVAVLGLTTVVASLLSVAVVVHFWDTPQRVAAAWWVAGAWLALWLLAMIGLVATLRQAAGAFDPVREELDLDWQWVRRRAAAPDRGSKGKDEPKAREPRPATREALLARIARQRERIAMLEAEPSLPRAGRKAAAPPADESASAVALRLAREHPVATAALAAGAVLVLRPRRLLRVAAWVVPVLWRMR